MNKKYEEYAVRRRKRLDDVGRTAMSVFTAAYELGGTLLEARRQCGITQQELSDMSGVAQADISRFERGVITPSVHTLLRLVHALGANVAIVFNAQERKGSLPARSSS